MGRQARRLFRELARGRDLEVGEQRLAIGPAFEEDQAQAIVRVDRHAMLEAAGLGARAGDVLEAQAAQLFERVEARLDRAGDDDHGVSVGPHRGRRRGDDNGHRPRCQQLMTETRDMQARHSWTVVLAGAFLMVGGVRAQPAAAANPLDAVPEKMPFDIPYGTPIAIDRAEAAIAAAVAEMKRRDWKMSVTIVDGGGNLVAFQRMDGAAISSIQVSQHKARSAAAFRRETKIFETGVQSGLTYLVTLDGVIAARGGI